jgi:hypothetical protein
VIGSYLLALASLISTHGFRMFSLAEVLAVAAFLTGIASWKLAREGNRWIVAGALLGLAGPVLLGIGVDEHDMTTHETTTAHPLLVHIHHVFFNLGFVCYLVSAVQTTVISLLGRLRNRGDLT